MRLQMDYDQDFVDLYNSFTYSDKGKRYLDIMGISRDKLDPASMNKLYFLTTGEDRTIDVNANVGSMSKSPNHWQSEVFKGLGKLISLSTIYSDLKEHRSKEVADKSLQELITGGLYFHDLSGNGGVAIPYCWAWSCSSVMMGRPYGQLKSNIPKRSDSFVAVLIESIFDMAHEQAGAIALPDLFVCLSYYYKKEGLDPDNKDDKYKIQNDYQRMIHSLNQTYRIGAQSAFTNVSIMDSITLKTTFEEFCFPDGTNVDLNYVSKLQNIFMEFMSKKDPLSNLPYRFPVTTVNIHTTTENEIVDKEFLENVCKYNSEGIFNIYITKGTAKLASCCRMINNIELMKEHSRFDSFGNAGLSIGSARVVTLNLPRIGRLSEKNKDKYKELLLQQLEITKELLLCQRRILQTGIDQKFLKYFDLGWITLSRMFSTVGIIGLWETIKEMGMNLLEEEGLQFAEEIFKLIETTLEKYSKESSVPFNLEQIPGEGAAGTLSKMDRLRFNDNEYKYHLYSNQFIPLTENVNLLERARIDGRLCGTMTGGSICHLNIGTCATPEQMSDLINYAIKCGLEHFALNPSFNVCENTHVILGKSTDMTCSKCGAKITDNYTRVVGYFTSVNNWNKARRKYDYPNRTYNYLNEMKEDVA